ncbi:MAG: hypothetical protein IKA02_02780 [Clostridia bacterium]|nr:hypothetical protein [Clostridia bacterium]
MKNKKSFGYEKILGTSLKGGDYFEIFYYNNDNEICSKDSATRCIIYEKMNNGSVVHTIYSTL